MEAYEKTLFEQVAQCDELPSLSDCTAENLRELTARKGIDFATGTLYERVLRSTQHKEFIQQVDAFAEANERPASLDAALVIVPGAFYHEFPHTGADGRLVREAAKSLGCRCEMIPISGMGMLAENAQVICDWLVRNSDKQIILVSISKGGSDVKKALAHQDAGIAFRRVAAWVNVCGILEGTPLVDWLLASQWKNQLYKLMFAVRGYRSEFMYELARGPGSPLDFPLRLPPHVRLASLIGFPLEHHTHNRLARSCHERLASNGPNDGNVLLADVCKLPGSLYPVWGADHYLQPERSVQRLLEAVLRYLGSELSCAKSDSPEVITANER